MGKIQEAASTLPPDDWMAAPQVPIAIHHTFAPGMYIRTATIPADTAVVGKQHTQNFAFFLIKGEVTLVTSHGAARVQAPYQAGFPAGAILAGWTHTEAVCCTVHVTDETDLEKLEAELVLPFTPATHFMAPDRLQ